MPIPYIWGINLIRVVRQTVVEFAKGDWQTADMPTTEDEATPEQRQRLADAVHHRRKRDLRWSQARVIEHGGPSTTTLTNIEKAIGPTPSDLTLEKLDDGLGWVRGSARAVLWDGAEPKIRDDSERVQPPAPVVQIPRLGGGVLRRLIAIRDEIDVVIDELRSQ